MSKTAAEMESELLGEIDALKNDVRLLQRELERDANSYAEQVFAVCSPAVTRYCLLCSPLCSKLSPSQRSASLISCSAPSSVHALHNVPTASATSTESLLPQTLSQKPQVLCIQFSTDLASLAPPSQSVLQEEDMTMQLQHMREGSAQREATMIGKLERIKKKAAKRVRVT